MTKLTYSISAKLREASYFTVESGTIWTDKTVSRYTSFPVGDHNNSVSKCTKMSYLKANHCPMSMTAPWLSRLKRLSSKQEIPSSNLGGASTFSSAACT